MSTNYKLRNDHVACVGHLRSERARNDTVYATQTSQNTAVQEEAKTRLDADVILQTQVTDLYARKLNADGSMGMSGDLQMNNRKVVGLANGTVSSDAVNKSQLDTKPDSTTVYTKTEADTLLATKPSTTFVDNTYRKIADSYTKTETDTLLSGKKNTGTFDTTIQNSTAKTKISCDNDRYISVTSNGNKILDVIEDEVN